MSVIKSDIPKENFGEYASQYLVGGVSSTFRRNPFTGKTMYASKADGPYIYDMTGRRFIDFLMGNGAVPLGHNRPEIMEAVREALERGFFAMYDTDYSVEFARKIIEHVPCAEKVRYTNSGSEATLLTMRLARGHTGRDKIVRIDGHFHGGHDYALCNNLFTKADMENDGTKPCKITNLTSGIPQAIGDTIYLIPWNRAEVFEKLASEKGDEIAAIIMNPVDYNNGCVTTTAEYLQEIRDICDKYGIVLIFDEVLAGFRTGLNCAQGHYGVTPDLCCLAKALTNGVPLAAVAGKEKIMMKIMDPEDPVVAGGTFTGNLVGCAAGLAAFSILEREGFYEEWLGRAGDFFESLQQVFDDVDYPASIQHHGCSFFIYPGTRECVQGPRDFGKLDLPFAIRFIRACEEKGVYFHSDFTVSAMHDRQVLDEALNVIGEAVNEAKEG
jgi:glutamate-1-semialdehyde 2,1-aminomutase